MDSKTIRDIIVGLLVTIIGGVAVAWAIQEGARFQPTPTVTADNNPLVTPTPNYPHIFVENRLVLPAKVYINAENSGNLF